MKAIAFDVCDAFGVMHICDAHDAFGQKYSLLNLSTWPRATSPGDQKMALPSASTPEERTLSTTDRGPLGHRLQSGA